MKCDNEVEASDAVLSAVGAISRPLEQNACMGKDEIGLVGVFKYLLHIQNLLHII